jgi:hypothetical protein
MNMPSKTMILSGTAIVAVFGVALVRHTLGRPSEGTGADPQSAIYATLNAARAGDIKAYLAGFTGRLSVDLQRTVAEYGEAAFSEYLHRSNTEIRGVVVKDPHELRDNEVSALVEYVFQDRNEAQTMYLNRSAAGWKIARIDGDQRIKVLIPYGTPIR